MSPARRFVLSFTRRREERPVLLLAHEHRVTRESLCVHLERASLPVRAEAADALEARDLAEQVRPDVAIVDLAARPIEAIRAIAEVSPRTRPVLLTALNEASHVVEAVREGVKGYVLKSQTLAELVGAVRAVAGGAEYWCPAVASVLLQSARGSPGLTALLTGRQRDVLRLVAEGKTTKEIAGLLGVSVKTADSHRTRLMEKLELHETAGLVRYAIRHGLIEP
jgi:two-component system response regulator NreC